MSSVHILPPLFLGRRGRGFLRRFPLGADEPILQTRQASPLGGFGLGVGPPRIIDAIRLPKEVVSRLRTRAGAPLFLIEAPDGGYQLTPYDPAFERKMAKAEEIIGRYRNTLHVLAKR